jgi:DNA-binding transcriptional ArsR family regulator
MTKQFEQKVKEKIIALSAINHSLRKDIIRLIQKRGSLTVSEICFRLNQRQDVISQHLKVLRKPKLVSFQKEGRFNFYSVNQEELDKIVE